MPGYRRGATVGAQPLSGLLGPDDVRRGDGQRRLARIHDLDVGERESIEHARQRSEHVRAALESNAAARLGREVEPELVLLRDRLFGYRLGRRRDRTATLFGGSRARPRALPSQEFERHDISRTCCLRSRNRTSATRRLRAHESVPEGQLSVATSASSGPNVNVPVTPSPTARSPVEKATCQLRPGAAAGQTARAGREAKLSATNAPEAPDRRRYASTAASPCGTTSWSPRWSAGVPRRSRSSARYELSTEPASVACRATLRRSASAGRGSHGRPAENPGLRFA